MSVMIGVVTERIVPDTDYMIPGNLTEMESINITARDEERVRVAAAVTIMSGLIQVNIRINGNLGVEV